MDIKKKPAPGAGRETGLIGTSGDANSTPNISILCPRWERCSVPLCPLDPDVFKRPMRDDEPVCYYLTEAVKIDAEAIFRRRGRAELFTAVSKLIPSLSARWGRIRRALERARTKGSRMATVAPWEVDHVGRN